MRSWRADRLIFRAHCSHRSHLRPPRLRHRIWLDIPSLYDPHPGTGQRRRQGKERFLGPAQAVLTDAGKYEPFPPGTWGVRQCPCNRVSAPSS